MAILIAFLLQLAVPRQLPKLEEIPFTQVKIADNFWAPKQEVNRKVSIPHLFQKLEEVGTIRNFERAAKGEHTGYEGLIFSDSDLYKTIESASYSLASHPDKALDAKLDALIAKIAAAQMPDGYLDTWFQVNAPDKRWTNLRDTHELYCAGHMFEAAVAHYQATGKRTFLNVAIKLADLIAERFGPDKKMGYPGHPECELALMKLWHATGDKKYFELARFFIENRGSHYFATEHNTPPDRYDGSYWQDDVPIRDHNSIVGHAVRAGYLFSGATDVARETDDEGLLAMLERVWKNTTQRRMYVTGGMGPSASNEGFTTDYDLPNLTAYQETCASVAMVLWNHRLNLLYGNAKYADVMETALYNGMLAGVSLDGSKFFYVNSLESKGNHHRSSWFVCACCPPNETRTLASLGSYIYAKSKDSLYVNLYVAGSVETTIADKTIKMDVETNYPWNGAVKIVLKLERAMQFALRLRAPIWNGTPKSAFKPFVSTPRINDGYQKVEIKDGYYVIDRIWKPNDIVTFDLQMKPRMIVSDPRVKDNIGRVALAKGPLIYCLEACDNVAAFSSIYVNTEESIYVGENKALGVQTLEFPGRVADVAPRRGLYNSPEPPTTKPITAIPYYAWDNRKPGEMKVWIPTSPPPPIVGGAELSAKVNMSFISENCSPWAINDGVVPDKSNSHPGDLAHWWPHKGGQEWVQYTWTQPVTVNGSKVYWFDDTGTGECRFPASWKLEYKEGDEWKPIGAKYAVAPDKWCDVSFKPIKTTALRLIVDMQPNWAAGIHEWKVITEED